VLSNSFTVSHDRHAKRCGNRVPKLEHRRTFSVRDAEEIPIDDETFCSRVLDEGLDRQVLPGMIWRRADDVCAVANMGRNLPLHASSRATKTPPAIQ